MNFEEIMEMPVNTASYCFIDVETTGLSPVENSVIEIGAVKVAGLRVGAKYSTFVNPGRDVPYFITQLTGITNSDVADAPFFDEIADNLKNFVGDTIIGGHNFSFDNSFLKKEYNYCGVDYFENPQVCTLRISRRLYPQLKSKSLGNVAHHLNLKNSHAHRALDDALVTARIFIKMVKELQETQGINTVSELLNYQYTPQAKNSVKIKKKLGQDVASLPSSPGIYFYLNAKEQVIYIGKAKSLKDRISSYFVSTAPKKAKKIVTQASRLKIKTTNSELTALLAEAEMIKRLKPRYNTLLKKYGNKYFLRFIREHNYPRAELAKEFDFDGNDYFGPFNKRDKATALLELIDKTFSLRECSDKEFFRKRKCLLADIERCTAPCVSESKVEYEEELARVYDFLYGKNQFALNRLLSKMKLNSDQMKFEAAAEYKRLIELILSQVHRSSLIAEPINNASVLFEISETANKDFILLVSGKIYIRNNIITNDAGFETALDDFFENTIYSNAYPDDEDLEKIKISLSWLVKNRNKVRVFYLKEYANKQKLYESLSRFGTGGSEQNEFSFDIKDLMNNIND